jgi:purine-nucleoside phosphorylase
MHTTASTIKETRQFLSQQGIEDAAIGIVMGTGLGMMAQKINIIHSIPYYKIPHFPAATVEFHKGNLLYGSIADAKVIGMQGRFHYYEGYSMQQITFPIRIMKELGIKYLLLSNAAGGINLSFKKGDLVLIEDHINLLPDNPLRGLNDPYFGNRFVDMSQPYDETLNNLLIKSALDSGSKLQRGIYASVMGPNLETKAEYRHLKNIGADLVGMSTVPEVIVANQVGIKCAAISVVTDECDPDNLKPVNIQDIIEVAGKADATLSTIFENAVKLINPIAIG